MICPVRTRCFSELALKSAQTDYGRLLLAGFYAVYIYIDILHCIRSARQALCTDRTWQILLLGQQSSVLITEPAQRSTGSRHDMEHGAARQRQKAHQQHLPCLVGLNTSLHWQCGQHRQNMAACCQQVPVHYIHIYIYTHEYIYIYIYIHMNIYTYS